MTNREEIERRRTFAIISHPDAGKTTLTEKLLLYGGAINQAGSVKGKQSAKHAVSDWMDIEKPVSYTYIRAHETRQELVCRLLLEKKKKNIQQEKQSIHRLNFFHKFKNR